MRHLIDASYPSTLLLAVLGACQGSPSPSPQPGHLPTDRPMPGPRVACSLHIQAPASVAAGRLFDQVEVELRNDGSEPVTIVKPGDGSTCGWRTPRVAWSLLPAGSPQEHPERAMTAAGGRCGNINALAADEVVALAPGERCELGDWLGLSDFRLEPGIYRMRFYYENDPSLPFDGLPLGEHDPAALRALRASTPLTLVSEEVRIEILP